jgi:hypothetical protein
METDLVKDCLKDNPDISIQDLCVKTQLSEDQVTEVLCMLAIQAQQKTASVPIAMTQAQNLDIFTLLSDDPFRQFDDLLNKDIDAVLSDNKQRFDKRLELVKPLMVQKIYQDFETDKKTASEKLALCNTPFQGSRWLELKMRSQTEQMKILGLEPDKNQNIKVTIGKSKEDLDAIYEAANMNMFGDIINVTPTANP